MTPQDDRPSESEFLAFLEGDLDETGRERVLRAIETDAEVGVEFRAVARGWAALGERRREEGDRRPGRSRRPETTEDLPTRISPWWAVAAAAATLLLAVPSTLILSGGGSFGPGGPTAATLPSGQPENSAPSFVLVLQGRWPDAGTVTAPEAERRAAEYWSWTSDLATRSRLMAAGDLRWEPGRRLGPDGVPGTVSADLVETGNFVVGMIVIRAESYEEALEVARECPHLRYGGTVSVRQTSTGFVTMEGDWDAD